MRRLTLAQRRERALNNFNEDYIKDFEKASKIINSFNRLCGLSEHNCYLQNDARTCNLRSTKASEKKS